MRVLIVSGIWPPDVGGPASHAPEVASFLRSRGHEVEVAVTADAAPAPEEYPVRWVSRRVPTGLRHLAALRLIRARARRADVVYTTGMFVRSALGARLARRPYVVKLTGDPAFERARRFDGAQDVDTFQRRPGGLFARGLRVARDLSLRGASHVFCPSGWLRDLVVGWGVEPERVSVLPNPAPDAVGLAPREEVRARLGLDGPTLGWAGRLTAQKSLEVAFDALAAAPEVALVLAGDGPDRARLEEEASRRGVRERARFLGACSRREALELFAAADAAVLSSSWENFPHAVVEALAVGTPVIATDVGGVGEIVVDERNGLLVPPGDPQALGAAIRRYFDDPSLEARLRAAARGSVERFGRDRIFGELEAALADAAQ